MHIAFDPRAQARRELAAARKLARTQSQVGWFVTLAGAGFVFGVVFTLGIFTL